MKIVGTCGGVGSALVVGFEGLMVYIGVGIVSVCVLYWFRKFLCGDGFLGVREGEADASAASEDEDFEDEDFERYFMDGEDLDGSEL